MNTNLEVIRVADHSPEWYAERKKRIGSSEVGIILGLSEWSHSIKLFYEKVRPTVTDYDNARMFWGRELEDKVAENWQYWDGEPEAYIQNKKEGRLIRKCRRINGIIVNPEYPWLSTNLDRVVNKNQPSLIDGEPLDFDFNLECKTIHEREMAKWATSVPQYHLAQVTTQSVIIEVPYGEIALFDNSRNFLVYPVEVDEDFKQLILETTHEFFYHRVKPAQEWAEKLQWDGDMNNIPPQIQELEPDPDSNDAYREFWSEVRKNREEEVEIPGDDEVEEHARMMKLYQTIEKAAVSQATYHKNKCIQYAVQNGGDVINLGESGRLTYKMKGKSVAFNNYYSHDFSPEAFEQSIRELGESAS